MCLCSNGRPFHWYVDFKILTRSLIEATIATPISHCQSLVDAIGWFAAFSVAFNNFLFLARIRGVYYHTPWVRHMFLILWFTTLSTFTAALSFTAINIGTTPYCGVIKIRRFVTSGVVATAIYDTAVFFAISLRLISISLGKTWRDRFRNCLQSHDWTRVSNTLWLTGLVYYMYVVTFPLNFLF